jgi:YD repeat-containing protein
LTDGSLTQSVAFTTGSLNYVSNSVGNATVGVDASFDDASDEAYFAATLTLSQAGEEVGSNTVYYSATGAEDGTSYRFTVPIDGLGLATGTYSYSMVITPYNSDDSAGTTQTVTGTTNVLNRTNSVFGQGWNLDGLDQLVFDPSGYNVTYVRSDGTMGYFTSSDGLTYTSPAGPFAYMTLAPDGSGGYLLNDPSTGTSEDFGSDGALLTVTDHDGNVTTYGQPFDSSGTAVGLQTSYSYDMTTGMMTGETAPDGSTQAWSYASYTTYGGQYDVVTDYENALGNYTAYTYDTSTTPNSADLITTEQFASGSSSDPDDTGQNMAVDGGDPITTAVYTTAGNSSGVPLGLVYSTTDPDGLVSAFQYDADGNTTATYNGQVLGPTVADGTTTWTFSGLAPNADRTYDIFVEGSTSGLSVSGASLVSGATESLPTAALGGDWNWLGRYVLTTTDLSTPLVVSVSGTSTANVCLMEPMSTMVYDDADNLLSTTDPMGNISAAGYDDLDRPVTTSQGQAAAVDPSLHAAMFASLPQSPGMERTYTVYVQASSSPPSDGTGYSFGGARGVRKRRDIIPPLVTSAP